VHSSPNLFSLRKQTKDVSHSLRTISSLSPKIRVNPSWIPRTLKVPHTGVNARCNQYPVYQDGKIYTSPLPQQLKTDNSTPLPSRGITKRRRRKRRWFSPAAQIKAQQKASKLQTKVNKTKTNNKISPWKALHNVKRFWRPASLHQPQTRNYHCTYPTNTRILPRIPLLDAYPQF